jgi:mannose-6-phosphate isomerase-like protein (cupin superfamily)
MKHETWVTKCWGSTRCIYESSQFSGHELQVKAGGYCSVHYHEQRANRFIVDSGVIAVVEFYAWWAKRRILTSGKTHDVPSLVPHQFQVLQDGKIREEYWADRGGTVTQDDIVRLIDGDVIGNIEDFPELAEYLIQTKGRKA